MSNSLKKLLSTENISLRNALDKMNNNGKKCLVIVDKNRKLLGTLSDGDIRHQIKNKINLKKKIISIYNHNPKYIYENDLNIGKLKKLFINKKIFFLPVVNSNHIIKKVIFTEDLLNNIKRSFPKINTDVFIMAGGFGKRLLPLTEVLPKPLFPIEGEPIIIKIIKKFYDYKIKNYFISLNYKAPIIKSYLESSFKNLNFNYIIEKKPLGTAGSLKKSEKKIKNNFFLINSDIYIQCDLKKILDFHLDNKASLTIVSIKKNIKLPYGNCINDKNNNLIEIIEKPEFNFFINSGVYVLNKEILKLIPSNKFFNMDSLILRCLKNKLTVKVYNLEDSEWMDIGEWDKYNSIINKSNTDGNL